MIIKAIVNPKSGMRIMRAVVQQTLRLLKEEGWLDDADIRYTTPDGLPDSDEWMRQPCDVLFVAGGDGTLHLLVSLMQRHGIDVPVAYLPTGTMNDMGHNLSLPRNPAGFVRMIRKQSVKRIDLGSIEGEYFHYVVAGGLMSRICYTTPQKAKSLMGRLGYYLEILAHLPAMFGGTQVLLEWDDGEAAREALVFMVSNASTLAGFPHMAPQARLDDGLLDVLVIGRMSAWRMINVFFRVLSGTHTTHRDVVYFQTRSITIRPVTQKTLPLVVDGEKGPLMPVRIEVVPRALSILVP